MTEDLVDRKTPCFPRAEPRVGEIDGAIPRGGTRRELVADDDADREPNPRRELADDGCSTLRIDRGRLGIGLELLEDGACDARRINRPSARLEGAIVTGPPPSGEGAYKPGSAERLQNGKLELELVEPR